MPAGALVKAVEALQRSIQLLAFAYEGEAPSQKQRLRASYEMERTYAVIFGIPEGGGYVLPYHIGNPIERLFAADDIAVVTQQYETV